MPTRSTPSAGRWAALRAPTLADPERRVRYERKRASVEATRQWLQVIDQAREEAGLSKAALAQRVGMEPSAIRRLFTSARSNPTLDTVVSLMLALGIEWDLKPSSRRTEPDRKPAARPRAPADREAAAV